MRNLEPTFKPGLRISPLPVLALLPPLGLLLYALGERWSEPRALLDYVGFELLMYGLAGLGYLVYRWRPEAGQWFAACAGVGVVTLIGTWLAVPGSLALAAIPVVLAVPLISLPAAVGITVAETALLAALYKLDMVALPEAGIAFIATWAALGAVWAVYRPACEATGWSWKYYREAQRLLDEARDRQAELKQALDDLARANRQLTRLNMLAQGLRQAAEDARAAKEQFVANVSHELRTPLNMIIGFSQMILQSPETYGEKVPPALLADLAVIRRNAEHLAELIDDVLDLSQIEADQMALVKERVPFGEIIEAAATAVRPLFDSKRLYLRTEIPDDLPSVFCDRTRMREVLLNLLSNAGRFTEHGGVELRAESAGDALRVSVADTGHGIAAEDMSKLFQPFQQVDGTIRRRFGGTGLGLSISKRFIELHGGRIWVESQLGAGTTFTFRLPIAPPKPADGDFSRWLTPGWEFLERTYPSLSPKAEVRPRLIILEKSNSLRRMLARYLGGIDITPVESLEEGIGELSRGPCQAFLVNEASVSAALQQIESAPLPYGVPVMICSVPGTATSAEALGTADYLVKPVSMDALLGTLERLNLSAGTILIVDDEPEALRLFRRMLASSGKGYHVLRAKNGREALLLMGKYRPDAILLDLVMPQMDGFQLLEAKNRDPLLCDIPVIIVTAQDPLGQPVVSNALAVTRQGGLSAGNLLMCVKAISEILALPGQPAGPALTAAPPG